MKRALSSLFPFATFSKLAALALILTTGSAFSIDKDDYDGFIIPPAPLAPAGSVQAPPFVGPPNDYEWRWKEKIRAEKQCIQQCIYRLSGYGISSPEFQIGYDSTSGNGVTTYDNGGLVDGSQCAAECCPEGQDVVLTTQVGQAAPWSDVQDNLTIGWQTNSYQCGTQSQPVMFGD